MGGSTRYRSPTGDRLWEYDTGTLIHTAPAVAGRYVYIGTHAGDIHVVDRTTGEPVQIIPTGVALTGQIVITERGLYVTSEEAGTLVVLR